MNNVLIIIAISIYIAGFIWDWHYKKTYTKRLSKEITSGLVRRVVLIEGRCAKCNERIPDEKLTDDDMKRKDTSVIQ